MNTFSRYFWIFVGMLALQTTAVNAQRPAATAAKASAAKANTAKASSVKATAAKTNAAKATAAKVNAGKANAAKASVSQAKAVGTNAVGPLAAALASGDSLTIDARLQQLAMRLMRNKQGSIIAIEPATGRILALVSHNRVDAGVDRAISSVYSPGSTFKVAQALEMLSEGVLTAESSYPCSKGFSFNRIHIGCHDHRAPLSLVQAIGQSCNSYFCKAFQEMIDNRQAYATKQRALATWDRYMHSMGLGHALGVDLPGEASGTVPDSAMLAARPGNWNGSTIMWVGMGQGEVQTTSLQLCNLAALVANRGHYYIPHVHESTAARPLDARYTTPVHSLATPEAFRLVVEGMRACVVNGTAASINTPAYAVCGKTGTAENEGADHSIFMGFAPMDTPRIAVSVYVENGGFGADLAAPLASLIIEQWLTGTLSAASEKKASRWENKTVKVTPVEVPVSFDDL